MWLHRSGLNILQLFIIPLFLSTCGKTNSNCLVSPNGLVSWWDARTSSSSVATALMGQASGQISQVSVSQDSVMGKVFLFQPYLSSFVVTSSTDFSFSNQFTLSARVKGNRTNAIGPFTQTVLSKGESNPQFTTTQFSVQNLASLVDPNAIGLFNGTYDGRYLYFPKYGSSLIVRYDQNGSFTSSSSWSTQSLTSFNSSSVGNPSAVFDGRYVYFTPRTSGLIARLDPTGSFSSSNSWMFFDATGLSPFSTVYTGAITDNTYVYFINKVFTRYQIGQPFNSKLSWKTVDLSTIDSTAGGYDTGIYDGRYVYLVPGSYGGGNKFARFDTLDSQAVNLSSTSSWSFFDFSTLNSNAVGYTGATFDGRYIYMVPYYNFMGSSANSTLARFDTTATQLSSSSAWSFLDLSGLVNAGTPLGTSGQGFRGGVFDGRYVHLIPYGVSTSNSIVLRFDSTSSSLSQTSAWNFYDLTGLSPNAKGFTGGVFDGRYVYDVPFFAGGIGNHGNIARYDTRANLQSFGLYESISSSSGNSDSHLGPMCQLNTDQGFYMTNPVQSLDNQWHLLNCVYDGSYLRLYLDGALAQTTSATGSVLKNNSALTVGTLGSSPSSYNGEISDIQLFNRALSETEIQSISSSSLCR